MPEPETITTETAICSFIGIVGDLYTDTSTHSRLTRFKNCLFYCSVSLSNPMFLSIAEDSLSLSTELLYIHELMYRFMCKEHDYLKFAPMESISSRYEPSSFKWNIPDFLVPFLTAYILAAFPKNEVHSSQFFQSLDDYFNLALEKLGNGRTYNKESLTEQYHEWTDQYLGRQYFCTLDSLYQTFARNDKQKRILRDSIGELSRILVECPVFPSKIPVYVTTLLEHYRTYLVQKAQTPHPTAEELRPFYEYDEPWKIENELAFITQLSNKLSDIAENLCSYIKDYLKKNGIPSEYKIAVNDFDDFREKYDAYICDIDSQLEQLEIELRAFYHAVENTPSISQAINYRRLSIDKLNEDKHT